MGEPRRVREVVGALVRQAHGVALDREDPVGEVLGLFGARQAARAGVDDRREDGGAGDDLGGGDQAAVLAPDPRGDPLG
ncbi:hypothetical protein [Kitasatospora sp. NPDC093679]|uniref:hypothetical protein n=1 Tax=Kitasatospora sp. NPDC093679 TaxID=3154983 RepID=UPI00341C7E5F